MTEINFNNPRFTQPPTVEEVFAKSAQTERKAALALGEKLEALAIEEGSYAAVTLAT